MGRVECLGISKASQTAIGRLMESWIAHQSAGSVGGRAQKRGNGLCLP